MQHSHTQQRGTKCALLEKRYRSNGAHRQEQFDVQCAGRVKTEAPEFDDVIHQIVILQISKNVFMQAPAVRTNKGCQQTGQRRHGEPQAAPPGEPLTDGIYENNDGTQQETAVQIGPKSRKQRQRV